MRMSRYKGKRTSKANKMKRWKSKNAKKSNQR